MIRQLNQLIHSKAFSFIRIMQFLIAVAIFTGFALMPSKYATALPASAPSLHFIGNFLLFSSAWVAWHGRTKLWFLVVLLVIYSVAIELAQWLTPSRTVDKYDLAANMAGLFAAFCFTTVVETFWQRLVRKYAFTAHKSQPY